MMGKPQFKLWAHWANSWERDPLAEWLGVGPSRLARGELRAVFRTRAGVQVEADIAQLRSQHFAIERPGWRPVAHTFRLDPSRLSAAQQDQLVMLNDAADLLNDLNYARRMGKAAGPAYPGTTDSAREKMQKALQGYRLKAT